MNVKKKEKKKQVTQNKVDKMKENLDYDTIDLKFIDAIDEVLEKNDEMGIKPSNDSSLGKLIYPSNRSIISSVRSRSKHIPHLALINFAKIFDVDMNYFYGRDALNYLPKSKGTVNNSNNSVHNTGNNNTTTHAGNRGTIKEVKNVQNEVNGGSMDIDTMIINLMAKLDKECVDEFYKIIKKMRKENKKLNKELNSHLKKKSKKIEKMAALHSAEVKSLQKELKKSNQNLLDAQKNESDILKKYISSLEAK